MTLFAKLLLLFIPAVVTAQTFNCPELRLKYQCPGTEKYPIHLSFDDGPADLTPELLDTLKQEKIPATFFVIAKRIECGQYQLQCQQGKRNSCHSHQLCLQRRATLQRTREEGHMIGSHSYLHIRHSEIPTADMEALIVRSKQLLAPYLTTSPAMFRLPFGDGWFNRDTQPQVLQAVEKQGFKHIAWEMSAYDWRKEDQQGDRILRTVMNEICTKKKGLILFHDGDADQEHVGRTFTGENIAQWIPIMRCVADFKPLQYFYPELEIITPPQTTLN